MDAPGCNHRLLGVGGGGLSSWTGNRQNFGKRSNSEKPMMRWLHEHQRISKIFLVVWTQCRSVNDRQTGPIVNIIALHTWKKCARTIKTLGLILQYFTMKNFENFRFELLCYEYSVAFVVSLRLSCNVIFVAKRCVLAQKLLMTAYKKSYMRNRLVPKRMTLTFV